jgi:hypothetical protein
MKQQTNGNYAFVYSGYLDVPRDGAYTFHAPREFVYPYLDSGYDLRVFVDGKEWYPATRLHNFGGWTVPLAKGLHTLKVYWVDQRPGQAQWAYPDWSGSAPSEGEENRSEKYMIWRGDKPTLEISGPGLDRQPVPDGMLYSARGSNLIVAWSNSRFTTSGVAADSNCVTDHVTGLMWLKNPDTTARTFTNAIAYCEGLAGTDGRGNYTDWRLPSRDELHSLVDARADDHPPLPPDHPFMDVQTGFYWAGPTGADSRDSAYKVNLYDGYVYDAGKEYLNYVWPVRGGQRK